MPTPKGKGVYKGTHWTQQPENRERLMAMNKRTTKKAKMRQVAKMLATKAQKYGARGGKNIRVKTIKDTTLIINGWRITLGKDEIRIE